MDNLPEIITALGTLGPDTFDTDIATPFGDVEEIGGDVSFGSSFGDVNLPFGTDALDVTDSHDVEIHPEATVNGVGGA